MSKRLTALYVATPIVTFVVGLLATDIWMRRLARATYQRKI